ncbi:S-4TM family putative pore-forming effector [Paenibacillus sp. VMFN-D1]|uniref:S-4TM family putative pore-forming effector n=1 Tax=Paenibacillus sp. VMFN-D1 TaxID=2135608 RepID=UPI000E2764AB|nr:S-4TM family putative pore-forming effector [Paenibacillus sp. VMFN-D1]RED32292.1 hypothetical protein C7820_5570 [Paenibacillus sp. VMFN-D1]
MLDKQNESQYIKLLVAMRYYYNKAKLIHRVRVYGVFAAAIISGFLGKIFPSVTWLLVLSAVLSAGWLIIHRLVLMDLEKSYTKRAATIQEEFDTKLFGLSWHKSLVGSPIKPEQIAEANIRFKGERDKLKDWYVGLSSSEKWLNVLIAQRMNLAWDSNLRKRYAYLVLTLTILCGVVTILLSLQTPLLTYILSFLFPTLPILLHGFETFRDHLRRSKSCEQLGSEVLTTYNQNKEHISPDINQRCREYQDAIFHKRCDITLIPNRLYWLSRNQDDSLFKTVNEELSS